MKPSARLSPYLRLVRPGDWLVIAGACALCGVLVPLTWRGGQPEKALVRSGGAVYAEIDLQVRKTIEVPGPLGTTVIAIDRGRARVVADPGPRQYCVHQGWLARPGDVAICAPNRVSLQILGRGSAYDSLAY